ncbi:putative Tristetraproline [Fasciolopsis buskii]|uniref:Putative Tristetraproline n=1 Tax=Fasciolopsis buskii TaxID=27845 RepID=A0A8E0S4P5_9TREM|nr:putative Tristetraproline [Fasciolopsis buski]
MADVSQFINKADIVIEFIHTLDCTRLLDDGVVDLSGFEERIQKVPCTDEDKNVRKVMDQQHSTEPVHYAQLGANNKDGRLDYWPNSVFRVYPSAHFKTEFCQSYLNGSNGRCSYGEKCRFAHGLQELHVSLQHPRYKTVKCHTFQQFGNCRYGSRCTFIHDESTEQLQVIRYQNALTWSFKRAHPGVSQFRLIDLLRWEMYTESSGDISEGHSFDSVNRKPTTGDFSGIVS